MKRHNPSTVRTVDGVYQDIYAHAVETQLGPSRQLHISGQLGIDPEGHLPPGFGDQLRQALRNVENILQAADLSKDHIVKVSYFLTHSEHLPELNAIRAEVWRGVRPAVTTLLVAGLVSPEYLIEVEVLAQEEAASGS